MSVADLLFGTTSDFPESFYYGFNFNHRLNGLKPIECLI